MPNKMTESQDHHQSKIAAPAPAGEGGASLTGRYPSTGTVTKRPNLDTAHPHDKVTLGFFRLLQLADSSCPTGGFAHSNGVEMLVRDRTIFDESSFTSALSRYVRESLAGRELVFVALAWMATLEEHCDTLKALGQARRAMLMSAVVRDADLQRAAALFRLLSNVNLEHPVLAAALTSYPVLFGAVGAVVGETQANTVAAYAFQQLNGMVTAGIRLGVVGPYAAQRVLWTLAPPLREALTILVAERDDDQRNLHAAIREIDHIALDLQIALAGPAIGDALDG